MRITNIAITNYRALREFSFQFKDRDNFLVLAGLNGSGKSSLHEAVLTALGTPFDMREPLKEQEYKIDLRAVGDLLTYEVSVAPGMKNKRGVPSFNALYFSSWRAPKRVHGISLKVGKKGCRPDKEERNALWNLKQWLVSLPSYVSYPSGQEMYNKISQISEDVNQMWLDFYPDRDEKFVADIESNGAAEMAQLGTGAEPKFELYLTRASEGGRISVDELSSGEIEILSLFGTLIADKALTGKPLDFVFLDEPELHLNPVWHRMLVPMLRKYSPGTQFFIATHSPVIWDSVYSTERVFLEDGRIKANGILDEAFQEAAVHG